MCAYKLVNTFCNETVFSVSKAVTERAPQARQWKGKYSQCHERLRERLGAFPTLLRSDDRVPGARPDLSQAETALYTHAVVAGRNNITGTTGESMLPYTM